MQLSPSAHAPSPHASLQPPQSCGQSVQLSDAAHEPSPQPGAQPPQSCAQSLQVSAPEQSTSPQTSMQTPQSSLQLAQLSPSLQVPSPQPACVHSAVHVGETSSQSSPGSTMPLPQVPSSPSVVMNESSSPPSLDPLAASGPVGTHWLASPSPACGPKRRPESQLGSTPLHQPASHDAAGPSPPHCPSFVQ